MCTAGVMPDGRWIRIHPVPFRLKEYERFRKYTWIELDLKKHRTDKRPESYSPDGDHKVIGCLDTDNKWRNRKAFVLKNVYYSYPALLDEVMSESMKSLAVLQPSEILDFEFEETDREWSDKWKRKWLQGDFFHRINTDEIIKKVPYKFYYVFKTENDDSTHRISITDWEVGALYWECMKRSGGDEKTHCKKSEISISMSSQEKKTFSSSWVPTMYTI